MQEVFNVTRDFLGPLLSELLLMLCVCGILFVFWQFSGAKKKPSTGLAATHPKKKRLNSKQSYDSDNTTEVPGEFSNNEFSEMSSHTDGDAGMYRHGGVRTRKPSGLHHAQQRGAQESCLNAAAQCFVPLTAAASHPHYAAAAPRNMLGLLQGFSPDAQPDSEQLRNSIQMLKGALTEWEANLPAPENRSCLLDALAKLTPDQAATVRSMLDNKLEAQGPHQPTVGAFGRFRQSNQPAWGTPQNMTQPSQRTHVPFQGSRNPWDQTRPLVAKRGSPGVKTPTQRIQGEESLSTQLAELSLIDNKKVLIVRKINRLGLESAGPLKEHFIQFGTVERVMVAPTRGQMGNGANSRVRPAPLGFVVMSTAAEVEAVLAQGIKHEVAGVTITVANFTSHSIDGKD